jgi:hypothetical protein
VVIFRFDKANRDESIPLADAFRVDEETGLMDMSAYDSESWAGPPAPLRWINFDTGWWDPTTQTVWHAQVARSKVVYQSTPEHFLKIGLGHKEPGTAYVVVTSDWFDPERGGKYDVPRANWPENR